MRGLVNIASVIVLLSSSPAALAQSIEDFFRQQLRKEAKASNLGGEFQSLTIFDATPGVSAAVFNPDHKNNSSDTTIKTAKIPLSFELSPVYADISPYGEATLAYGHLDDTFETYILPDAQTKIDGDFYTYSALAGVGITIPVLEWLRIRPIFLAGYSRINGDSHIKGPFSEELEEAASGILTDVHINTMLLGGAFQAIVETPLPDELNLTANARYNHFYARNFNSSDSVLNTQDDFGVFNTAVEFQGPIPLTIAGRETRWITFGGYTYLPGDQKDALDFDSFFELGGGFAIIDPNVVKGVGGLSARGSLIIGPDVNGWSAGMALEF